MKLFRGLAKTDYQDVLRAIGLFIDEHGYTDVRIIEIEDGLVLQGRIREQKGIGNVKLRDVSDHRRRLEGNGAHRRYTARAEAASLHSVIG